MKSDLTRSILEITSTWTNLKHLELGNSNFSQYTIYFCEHISPVLQALGPSLVSLSLEKLKYVDIEVIGQLCPRLNTLKLSRILSFSNTHSTRHGNIFCELTELIILNSLGSRLTEETLHMLLSAKKLEIIFLQFVPSMTGSVWSKLNIKDLKTLILEECSGVDLSLVLDMLDTRSRLQLISCISCQNIGEEERDQINTKIREENLCLEFNWYSRTLMSVNLNLEQAINY